MKRIGIFGGSFNPPHIGHILAAEQAMAALKLDKMLLIPTLTPPHKHPGPQMEASAGQRKQMLELAISGKPGFAVSDTELRREGPSYTADTLEILRGEYPEAELYLLLGTDMFLTVHSWYRSDRIYKNAVLTVACRGQKGEWEAIEKQKAALEAQGTRVETVNNPVWEISSTQLRRLLAFGCGAEYLPQGVGDYIRQQGLYDTGANWKGLPMEQLEKVVVRLLNPNRVAHVLGCRDTAVELAKRWGVDPEDAARAGILHDITKALDGPLQLTLCQAYGTVLSDFSRKYPKTLHALTGSLVAERIFGENERVCSAICHHTTGKANMNLLETILYVADYMEPNRDFPGVEELRRLAYSDIHAALRLGLEMTLEHLRKQGSEVSPESREALEYLCGEKTAAMKG